METSPTYRNLVPVFHGKYARAVLLRSTLEANGIEAFIPNENIKVADPFATGAGALVVEVVVAADRVEAAAEVLADLELRSRDAAEREAADATADDLEREELARIGRRVRYGVLCVVTLPFAAWSGVQYLSATSRRGVAPPDHGFNVLLSLVAIGATLLGAVLLIAT